MAKNHGAYGNLRLRMPEFLDMLCLDPKFSEEVKARISLVFKKAAHHFKKVDIRIVRRLFGYSDRELKRDYLKVARTLVKVIDATDPSTRGHYHKVMKYSVYICKKMKLHKSHTSMIKRASQLHDIGKISIDRAILKKKEPLTEEDWQKIRMHPEIGARIIEQTGLLDDIVPIIRHHHERFDGGGYPDGSMKSGKIPLGARIIAVADAFDAMTTDRPYRKAMERQTAMGELQRCAGSQFDPEVVDAFAG